MAVSNIKKLSVICTETEVETLVKKLMWLSCVDIEQEKIESDSELSFEKLADIDSQIAENNKLLTKIKTALDLLDFHRSKKWASSIDPSAPQKKLFSPPDLIDFDEFMEAGRYDLNIRKLNKLLYYDGQIKKKTEEKNELLARYKSLGAWIDYDCDLGQTETKFTQIRLGTLPPKSNVDALNLALADTLAEAQPIGSDDQATYLAVICHKNDGEKVNKILLSYGFAPSDFKDCSESVTIERENIQSTLERLEQEIEQNHQAIASMVGIESQLQIVYDIVTTENVKLGAKKKILKTGSVCTLLAYLPSEQQAKVQKTLEKLYCAFEFSTPDNPEETPVLLQNNRFASSFEPVISLYSLPKYGTFDPSMIMSIFYMIIFGLMFADVGYGLVLSLGCLLGVRFLYPRGTFKKFLMMFGLCGLSCAVCGALMGGYFGDLITRQTGVDLALVFDPLKEPMTFLILSLAVGAVHLVTGMVIKMVILVKQGDIVGAIFDNGSWLVLFFGLGLLFVQTILGGVIAGLGALMLVCSQGRKEKNVVMKVGKGLISLYGITSYISDLLSYSRILALGLASAVIAQVINVMAGLFEGKGVLGTVVMVIILVGGHLLNMVINLLGTFVHCSRLQYIEFFGKFYEDGGIPFETLAPESKYVIFKNKSKE